MNGWMSVLEVLLDLEQVASENSSPVVEVLPPGSV